MVANGAVELTSLKAKFGADIRRTALRHSNDLTHNDLVLLLQRIFSIDPAAPVALKYRDSDGDLVSLTNDDDVLHAVQTSNGSLFVHVFATDDSKQELFELERQLEELIARAGNVLESVRSGSLFGPSTETLSAPSKPVARADHHDHRPSSPLSSPRQNVATIQPSLQQQVFADGQAHKVGSEASQVEEDIPLDNSFNQYNHVNDFAPPPPPASNDFAPPPTSQTPQNFGPPPTFTNQQPPQFSSQPLSHPPVPQQPEQQAPPNFGPPSGIPSFPQSQAPPPAPTQQPPSNPSAPPPSNFPNFYQQQPQHEATPTPPPVQQQFYAPPTSQQSVQPPQPPTSQGYPPSGPPQYSTGYTATPPPAPTYTQPTSQFTPPTSQYGAPPSQFGAPPNQFSTAPQGFAPPTSAPGSFAPPQTSAPSFAPPGGFPGGPGGPPPVGPPGPGYGGQPNPFGPRPGQPGAYRSSPYQM